MLGDPLQMKTKRELEDLRESFKENEAVSKLIAHECWQEQL